MFSQPQIDRKIDEIVDAVHNAKVIHKQDYWRGTSYRVECMKHTRKTGGLWLEFGVYRGRSLQHFAEMKPHENFYGFDSFAGLPEEWFMGEPPYRTEPKGYFNLNGIIPPGAQAGRNIDPLFPEYEGTEMVAWASNVTLVKGWFEDTLPRFLENNPTEEIDFIQDEDHETRGQTIITYF